jgi:hypothetical protein
MNSMLPARAAIDELFHLVHTSCTHLDEPGSVRRSATPSPSHSPSSSPVPFSTPSSSSRSLHDSSGSIEGPRGVARVRAAGSLLTASVHDVVAALLAAATSPAFPCAPGCTRLTHGYLRPALAEGSAGGGTALSPSQLVGVWSGVHGLVERFFTACSASLAVDITAVEGDPRFTTHASHSVVEVVTVLAAVYAITAGSLLR